jgi:hypothetical protein
MSAAVFPDRDAESTKRVLHFALQQRSLSSSASHAIFLQIASSADCISVSAGQAALPSSLVPAAMNVILHIDLQQLSLST